MRQGVNGGLLTLTLFAAVLVAAFVAIGRIGRASAAPRRIVVNETGGAPRVAEPGEKALARARAHTAMAWALGVSLFIHCVVFVGVSYFGQILLIWYLGLAFVGSLTPARRRRRLVAVRRPGPVRPPPPVACAVVSCAGPCDAYGPHTPVVAVRSDNECYVALVLAS